MKFCMDERISMLQLIFRITRWNARSKLYACCHEPCSARKQTFRFCGMLALAVLAAVPLLAQREAPGSPEDWSHHHVVFSSPGTLAKTSGKGTLEAWHEIV